MASSSCLLPARGAVISLSSLVVLFYKYFISVKIFFNASNTEWRLCSYLANFSCLNCFEKEFFWFTCDDSVVGTLHIYLLGQNDGGKMAFYGICHA